MSALSDLVFELLGQFLALPAVGLAINATLALLGALWLASAWWAYRDARNRVTDPFTPFLVATGVLVLNPLFFPMALVVWRVLRPSSTLRERYAADLQRELLAAGAERATCPACARPVDEAWVRCPSCGDALAAACPGCDRPAGLAWAICAWCATELAAGEGSMPAPAAPAPAPADATATRGAGLPGVRRAHVLSPSTTVLGAPGTTR